MKLDCPDDKAAIESAKQCIGGCDIELWQLIARLQLSRTSRRKAASVGALFSFLASVGASAGSARVFIKFYRHPSVTRGQTMLDTQNQGPRCTTCGPPMRLAAIEPSMWAKTGERLLAHNARGFSGISKVL
jgi:hypothetical protein